MATYRYIDGMLVSTARSVTIDNAVATSIVIIRGYMAPDTVIKG